eukprot:TRINITY_DN22050_c0_g1_i1.p1 TRINITY_DN22050_c0_g1~~TRINITY_DN22050_c0_g1_i1.p1  ORF type:complete len:342 (+),score=77.48 TRINITY_DN22050_c0_g1_i1:57-1028(+)
MDEATRSSFELTRSRPAVQFDRSLRAGASVLIVATAPSAAEVKVCTVWRPHGQPQEVAGTAQLSVNSEDRSEPAQRRWSGEFYFAQRPSDEGGSLAVTLIAKQSWWWSLWSSVWRRGSADAVSLTVKVFEPDSCPDIASVLSAEESFRWKDTGVSCLSVSPGSLSPTAGASFLYGPVWFVLRDDLDTYVAVDGDALVSCSRRSAAEFSIRLGQLIFRPRESGPQRVLCHTRVPGRRDLKLRDVATCTDRHVPACQQNDDGTISVSHNEKALGVLGCCADGTVQPAPAHPHPVRVVRLEEHRAHQEEAGDLFSTTPLSPRYHPQ